MRYQPEHKERARARMIKAAGRGFRQHGYGGIGVDGLAKEAGVTSGAFYGHFKSKDAAFREALDAGLDELRQTISALQKQHGSGWLTVFVDLYLGLKRTCDLSSSCALQSLTPEVQRSNETIKAAFEQRSIDVATVIAQGLEGPEPVRSGKAWALLALLTGAVTLARACESGDTGDQIAEGARQAARAVMAKAS